MSKIYIKFMNDAALATFKKNSKIVAKYIKENPKNNFWLKKIYHGDLFIEKKYKIPDFQLNLSDNNNYKEVDYENSIILYNALKKLPKYILTDERFWAWINFDKCYLAAVQAMPIGKSDSIVRNHFLFTQGKRRGLFFGVMSRCYFRVELTVDNSLKDPYELTKFSIENPERIRNLTWRSFSSQTHLVRGILKAEKKIVVENNGKIPSKIYPEIAKYVSKIGSVRLLDVISEDFIEERVYKKMKDLLISYKENKW